MTSFSGRLGRLFCWAVMAGLACAWMVVEARAAGPRVTTVADVVYRADGKPATGWVVISWQSFVTADGAAVAAGTKSVQLGADGSFTMTLAPNAGAIPSGSYYSVTMKLDGGPSSKEAWLVPADSPVKLARVRASEVPATIAVQSLTQDWALNNLVSVNETQSITGAKNFAVSPTVPDPVNATDAASKEYVDTTGGGAKTNVANTWTQPQTFRTLNGMPFGDQWGSGGSALSGCTSASCVAFLTPATAADTIASQAAIPLNTGVLDFRTGASVLPGRYARSVNAPLQWTTRYGGNDPSAIEYRAGARFMTIQEGNGSPEAYGGAMNKDWSLGLQNDCEFHGFGQHFCLRSTAWNLGPDEAFAAWLQTYAENNALQLGTEGQKGMEVQSLQGDGVSFFFATVSGYAPNGDGTYSLAFNNNINKSRRGQARDLVATNTMVTHGGVTSVAAATNTVTGDGTGGQDFTAFGSGNVSGVYWSQSVDDVNTGALARAVLATTGTAPTKVITDATLINLNADGTSGKGYIVPPQCEISDATATGYSCAATVNAIGEVTGITFSGNSASATNPTVVLTGGIPTWIPVASITDATHLVLNNFIAGAVRTFGGTTAGSPMMRLAKGDTITTFSAEPNADDDSGAGSVNVTGNGYHFQAGDTIVQVPGYAYSMVGADIEVQSRLWNASNIFPGTGLIVGNQLNPLQFGTWFRGPGAYQTGVYFGAPWACAQGGASATCNTYGLEFQYEPYAMLYGHALADGNIVLLGTVPAAENQNFVAKYLNASFMGHHALQFSNSGSPSGPVSIDTNAGLVVGNGLGETGLAAGAGTTANQLVKYSGASGRFTNLATNDTSAIGVATTTTAAGALAEIQTKGTATLMADGAIGVGDLVGISNSTNSAAGAVAGFATDLGESDPAQVCSNVQILGRVKSAPSPNAAGNPFAAEFFGTASYGTKICAAQLPMMSGDVSNGAGGGSLTVAGINGVPLCNGFSISNGQTLQYTTGSSPNPCYGAAGGGPAAGYDTMTSYVPVAPTANGIFLEWTPPANITVVRAELFVYGPGSGCSEMPIMAIAQPGSTTQHLPAVSNATQHIDSGAVS